MKDPPSPDFDHPDEPAESVEIELFYEHDPSGRVGAERRVIVASRSNA